MADRNRARSFWTHLGAPLLRFAPSARSRYSALKKKIYDIAAQTEAGDGQHGDVERAGLLAGQQVSGNDIFIPLLDRELEKIVNFYTHQEKEVLDELEEVRQLVEQTEEQGLVDEPYRDEDGTDEDEDDDDDETTNRSVSRDLSKQRRRKASSASGAKGFHRLR